VASRPDELARAGSRCARAGRRRLLERDGILQGLLTTVRGDAPPRIQPVYVGLDGGRLVTFVLQSAKLTDLERDGRYALHTHVDPLAPSEFSVRGRARAIEGELREEIASGWYFEVDETYRLFELEVVSALLGERPDADAWPPAYSAWTAAAS
jgi:hypothetical protein